MEVKIKETIDKNRKMNRLQRMLEPLMAISLTEMIQKWFFSIIFVLLNLYYVCLLIGLAAVVGGVFSNLASAANAILSSPNKLGTKISNNKRFLTYFTHCCYSQRISIRLFDVCFIISAHSVERFLCVVLA